MVINAMSSNRRASIMAKALSVLHPEIAEELSNRIMPLSTDLSLIQDILIYVDLVHETMDLADKIILFIIVAHKIYDPASLIGKNISKLPIGIRDEIAKCAGFNSPEMVSHYKKFGIPLLKNPRYRTKVNVIIGHVLPDHQDLKTQYN